MYLHGLDKNMLSAMSSNSGSSGPAPLTSTPTEETTEVSTPGVKDSGNERPKDKDGKELNEVDDLLAKIYSNQSACHMKKGNWKRAVETAEKVRPPPIPPFLSVSSLFSIFFFGHSQGVW